MPRLRIRALITLNLYGFALTLAVNIFDPAVLTAKVNQIVAQDGLRNTALGILTFVGLVVAAISQPVWGALSDRCSSRWGRRRPFLVGGTAANLLLFGLVAFAGDMWILGALVVLVQLASNAVQGAYQSLIPDQVPPEQHGVAAAAKSLVELPGVVVGPLVAGLLLGIGAWPVTARVLAVMAVLQAVYLLVTLLTLWRVPDPPADLPPDPPPLTQTVRRTFHVDWRASRDLRWWLANRALFWIGLLILRTFLINYVEMAAGLSPEAAQRTTGLLSAVLGVLTFAVALPSGYLADRLGRKPLVITSGVLMAVGAFLLLAARSLPAMFVSGVFIGVGGGLFITSSWALATELVPKEQAARYLGIANLATAGGSAVARLTGPVIDGINHVSGSELAGYVAVYALAGGLFLLSSWAISRLS